MVGYELRCTAAELGRHFEAVALGLNWERGGLLTPREKAPIIVRQEESLFGALEVKLYRLGLVPQAYGSEADADRYQQWYIRGDEMRYKRNQSALIQTRCIVPMTHFTTERDLNGELSYTRFEGRHEPILGAAGVFTRWQKPGKYGIDSFGVLTLGQRDPKGIVDYKTRAPVILDREAWATWLDPKLRMQGAYDMLEELQVGQVRISGTAAIEVTEQGQVLMARANAMAAQIG
jgi:putative SOS response-associated peptidase YedK